MADLNVINGKVFIPEMGVQRVGISIEKGKVACIGAEGQLPSAGETIDASGMYVLPGLISPHIHLEVRPKTLRSGRRHQIPIVVLARNSA